MSNYSRKKSEAGFSLLEIMVAFLVLSLGLITIAGSFPFGLKINRESANISAITYASQSKLEEMISTPYALIATGTAEARHAISDDAASDLYGLERETVVTLVDSNLNATTTDTGFKQAAVTVYYSNAIGRQADTYTSYVLISQR